MLTVACDVADPPKPVHVTEYVSCDVSGPVETLPFVALPVLKSGLVQLFANDDDHVIVAELPKVTAEGLTVTDAFTGSGGH